MTDPLIVKFGGSSLGNAQRIGHAADLAARSGRQTPLVVVASAMAGITDELVCGPRGDLLERHAEVARAALRQPDEVMGRLQAEAAAWSGHPSLGERLMVPILARAMRERGLPTVALNGDEAGIVVSAAGPVLAQTRQAVRARLRPLLDQGVVPVVAGFFGRSVDGGVALLGRGGSDLTATLVGSALQADQIWILTDVDGLKCADPRLIGETPAFPEVSYELAAQMALLGAKVLHGRCIEPAAQMHIPIRVASTFAPDQKGTLIGPIRPEPGLMAFTLLKGAALVHGRHGCRLQDRGVDVLAHTDDDGWLVGGHDLEGARAVLGPERVFSDLTVVGVISPGLATRPGIRERVLGSLAAADVPPWRVLPATSAHGLAVVLRDGRGLEALQTLRREFTRVRALAC